MGRRKLKQSAIRLMCIAVLLVLLAFPGRTEAAGDGLSLEQAYVYLPQVRVYVNGAEQYGELDPEQISVYREDTPLTLTGVQKFRELDEGIAYYVLLDVSGSIRNAYFADIKQAVAAFRGSLSDKDQMILITFGETVEAVLTGEETQEEAEARIAGLTNQDDETLLFEALARAGDMSSAMSKEEYKRRAVIVISDGEDVARGKATREEALLELQAQCLPVYAAAVDYEETGIIDSFGEFARSTGGSLQTFGQGGALNALQSIRNRMLESDVLLLECDSNKVSRSVETLTVQFDQWNLTKTIEAGFYDFASDEEGPQITGVSQDGENRIKVAFSEPVAGGEETASYQLKDVQDGTVYTPVSVEDCGGNEMALTFEEEFYTGDYTLATVNITDISMEENPVETEAEISLDGRKKDGAATIFLREHGYLIAAGAVAVLLAAGLLIFWKIRKNRGVVVLDDKMTMVSHVDVKRHVAMEAAGRKGAVLVFTICATGRKPARMEVPVEGSIIAGRSDMCDVFFDDEQMSRQHFALEYVEGSLFITDLDTTNGTMVNGARIRGKTKLEKQDTICAGTVEMQIDWREQE